MRLIIRVFLIILFITSCGNTAENKPKTAAAPMREKVYKPARYSYPSIPEKYLDTFGSWKQLMQYFVFDTLLTEEQLTDKTELILGTVRRINHQAFPPAFNNDVIKSRMTWLETETAQLDWVLKNDYDEPSPDSLFHRMQEAYYYLLYHMDRQTREEENFEEIFEAKRIRDSLLRALSDTSAAPANESRR